MEEFLEQADLSDLTEILKANDISEIEILGELISNPEELKNIIPSPGVRLKLQKHYREHFGGNNSAIQTLLCDIVNPIPAINLIQSQPEVIENNTQPDASTSDQSQILPSMNIIQQNSNQEATTKKRKKISDFGFEFDLQLVLEAHPIGEALSRIGSYQSLDSTYQSLLVNIICWELIRLKVEVKNIHFAQIAQQIVNLFPEECIETYYVEPVPKKFSKKNESEISKGKLPDKYRNLRGIINKAAKIGESPKVINAVQEQTEEIKAAEQSKLWLIHNREIPEVYRHWDISYILRESDVEEKKYATVQPILDIWPILKEAKSFELIERDFARKYPDRENLFILKWDEFFSDLLKVTKKKLSNQDLIYKDVLEKDSQLQPNDNGKLHLDSRTAIQFHLLALLVAQKSNTIRLPDKVSYWKPTVAESRAGIIIQATIPGDVEKIIDEKRSEMLKKKLSLQPHIVIIGKDLYDVKKAYVRIDSVSYELPSLLKALDVLFKLYMVFNIQYPLECQNFMYMIQRGIYNIETNVDTKIPGVYNILNLIKKLHKKK